MRIPFDIKYRPQIESGEYKLETECGHPVSIMDWEWMDRNEKKCLAVKVLMDEGFNIGYLFDYDGKRHSIFPSDSDSDLFIITPEPELSAFEDALKDCVNMWSPDNPMTDEGARNNATILRAIALEEFKEIEASHMKEAYEMGKAEALKDLPRWRKQEYAPREANIYLPTNELVYHGMAISVDELTKLPGFKEDSHE